MFPLAGLDKQTTTRIGLLQESDLVSARLDSDGELQVFMTQCSRHVSTRLSACRAGLRFQLQTERIKSSVRDIVNLSCVAISCLADWSMFVVVLLCAADFSGYGGFILFICHRRLVFKGSTCTRLPTRVGHCSTIVLHPLGSEQLIRMYGDGFLRQF
jgi:hypothetical protein